MRAASWDHRADPNRVEIRRLKGVDPMEARVGRDSGRKARAQIHFPAMEVILRHSLIAVQFGVLLTILLQVVGS